MSTFVVWIINCFEGFAAATALLGLSFEECVRKSAEVTVARAAIMPPPSIENALPASPAPPPPATPVLSAPAQPTTPVTPQQVEARCSSSAAQPIFSRSVSASSVPTGGGIAKDEYSRLNRRNTNGLYEASYLISLVHWPVVGIIFRNRVLFRFTLNLWSALPLAVAQPSL